MKKLVSFYESKDDEMTRSAIALILKAVSKANLETMKEHEEIIAPMVFFAMHGPKDEGNNYYLFFYYYCFNVFYIHYLYYNETEGAEYLISLIHITRQ